MASRIKNFVKLAKSLPYSNRRLINLYTTECIPHFSLVLLVYSSLEKQKKEKHFVICFPVIIKLTWNVKNHKWLSMISNIKLFNRSELRERERESHTNEAMGQDASVGKKEQDKPIILLDAQKSKRPIGLASL